MADRDDRIAKANQPAQEALLEQATRMIRNAREATQALMQAGLIPPPPA